MRFTRLLILGLATLALAGHMITEGFDRLAFIGLLILIACFAIELSDDDEEEEPHGLVY